MNKRLGVMQGRLLPKYQGLYQAHPVGYWQEEFIVAQKIGLSFIEFIFDYHLAELNPLMHQSGLEEIQTMVEKSGVQVKTICADYFMEAPLHSPSSEIAAKSSLVFQALIKNARIIGVTDIVFPCVDGSALKNEKQMMAFVQNIRPIRDLAEGNNIRLALETDLPPAYFGELLDVLDSEIFTVNYDTGNSASLGYDPEVELAVYGNRISDIHLKDRLRGGNSVELGKGNTDFKKFFAALSRLHYTGPLIMQAYRDEEGLGIFQKQMEWIAPFINDWMRPIQGEKP